MANPQNNLSDTPPEEATWREMVRYEHDDGKSYLKNDPEKNRPPRLPDPHVLPGLNYSA